MHVFRSLIRAVGLVLAAVALPFAAQAADPPPLSAYGQLPGVEDMALSVSGTRVAAVATLRGERVILMMDNQMQLIGRLAVGDVKVRSIEWIGDERLLVQISQTEALGFGFTADQHEFWRAMIIPADRSGENHVVFGSDRSMISAVFGRYGLRHVGGKWLGYFGGVELVRGVNGYVAPHYRPALFAVDLATNRADRVAQPGGENQDVDWLLRPDGTVAATFTINTRDGEWTIKGDRGRVLARGVAPRGDAGLISLGAEGTSVIYAEQRQQGDTEWYEVPLDGSAPPSAFRPGEDIDRLFIDRASGRLLGILKGGAEARPEFFSPAHQAVVRKVYAAFKGLDVSLADWTPDFSRVLVRTSGNGDSGTWYLVDVAQLRAEAVGVERPAVPAELVGPISTVSYQAGDGLDLDGILTLPPGREAKSVPLIVLPHGGPASHNEIAFDWWAQAFASRGYAVFQPNFRGSTNRDEAFIRAGYGQWGRKMQSDISDGLAELARQGIVDPKRACIVGGATAVMPRSPG